VRLEPSLIAIGSSLFINNNEAEAQAFINCNNEIRGSSLFINSNEAHAFIDCNNRIRGLSLFINSNEARASSLILMRLDEH
jgi:hypothetical protein